MKDFKSLGIIPAEKGFTGDKIKLDRILNKSIVVHGYRIEASKFDKGNGKCLHLQIEVDNSKRLLFSSGISLMDVIERIPKNEFPFTTTIVKQDDRLEFT